MDYRVYRLSLRQKGESFLIAAVAAAVISWLFYDSFWLLLFLPLWYLLFMKLRIQKELALRRELLLQQFLDMLRSLASALLAGYSIENALREASGEMVLLHGRDSYICRELKTLQQGLSVNIPLETLFARLAERADCKEITEFAEVFAIGRKSSGGIGGIIDKTASRISGRATTRKEIEVATASRRMEQRVMNGVPLFILLYLKLTDPSYMAVLYGNPIGILFMTVCLAAYSGAVLLAQRLAVIEV